MSLFKTLTVCATFAFIFSLTSNAARIPSNALETPDNKFTIELIDVKCDKHEDGMHVTVQFAEPFDGIIYSQRYFSDPKCRYVPAGQSEKTYKFVVPYKGCGSKPTCAVCDSIDNTLIIQQDEEVQGEFDAARKISCSRTGIDEEKKVFFKPFAVDMLDVVTVPTANGGVDCWMDIKRGIFPQLTSIGDVIKIGEPLTVLVYLRDQQKQYDLSVRNCWAYDSEDFDDKQTAKVQLSDASGCSMKRKLFGSWQKTAETGSSGATLLLHNTIRAFKFPDESQIYLKCDIEICRGNCAEAICDADELNKVDCTVDPLNLKCIKQQLMERSGSSIGFTTARNIPIFSSKASSITTREPLFVTTKRPDFGFTTTERLSYTSTPINRAFETTQAPETTTFREATTSNPSQSITSKKPYDSFCAQYPKSKRCNQRVTDDLGSNLEILTFKPPSPFATVKYRQTTNAPKSFTDNEIVPTTESRVDEPPLICKGDDLDPRCPNPTPTNTPPTYLPPSTTIKMDTSTLPPTEYTTIQPTTSQTNTNKPTNKLFICVPGSNDVNCDYESTKATEQPTTKLPITEATTRFIPSRNQITTKKPTAKPNCYIGSTNPECQKVSRVKPKPFTTSTPAIASRQDVTGTTRAPVCYPGSLDKRCSKPTTKKPIPDNEPVIIAPVCYPGSPDPHCPKMTTTTQNIPSVTSTAIPTTNAYIVSTTTRSPICYPGSRNPQCIQSTTTEQTAPSTITTEQTTNAYTASTITQSPICYPGSRNPQCIQSTTTNQIAQSTITTDQPTNAYTASTITQSPICYPGSRNPQCVQSTTTKQTAPSTITTEQTTNVYTASTTNRSPICYPGSRNPQCIQSTTPKQIAQSTIATDQTTEIPTSTIFKTVPISTATPQPTTIISTTSAITTTEKQTTDTFTTKAIFSTTFAPRCYLGSLDPRCSQTTTKIDSIQTTTQAITDTPTTSKESVTTAVPIISTTFAPRCYPGSTDPKCSITTTQTTFTTFGTTPTVTTKPPAISTAQPSKGTARPPVCYPGALDPRCKPTPALDVRQDLPTQAPNGPSFRTVPNFNTAPRCYLGSLDPRCNQPTSTQRTNGFPTTTRPIFSTSQAPLRCYPGSLDPRCTTTQGFNPLRCGPGIPLDPRCPNPTPTAEPATYLPPFMNNAFTTTKPPIFGSRPTVPFYCGPNSIDSRCKKPASNTFGSGSNNVLRTTERYSPEVTSKPESTSIPSFNQISSTTLAPSTEAQKPIYTTTTRAPFTFPTFSTRRTYSSPQPFTSRPTTVSSTTENLLCYPGSPIEGCKSTFTTPSFCYPGSIDKRCPQSRVLFSTQAPTYLPPYPDARFNRVKRQTPTELDDVNEVVKFSVSFKPFKLR